MFLWLILAPLSAAISRDQTNAVRSLSAAVPLIVTISFGLSLFLDYLHGKKHSLFFHIPLWALYIFSFIYFLDAYFVHLPAHNSSYWRYGYKEAVNYVTKVQPNYINVVFEQSFNQPYIYFLFHQKYNPVDFQNQADLVDSQYKGDVGFETRLDNILFEQIDWSALRNMSNILVVANPGSIPPEIKNDPKNFPIVHEIKYLNGRDIAFDMIEIK
jgi:hypothetical protein